MIERVLVADDEPLMLQFIAETLRRLGKEVVVAEHGQAAIEKLEQESFDLVISDMKMPYKGGFDVLQAAKSLQPQCSVILTTAYGSIETAVEAMKRGAFNFLIKPFSPEALESSLEKVEEHLRLVKENVFYRDETYRVKCPHLVSQSPAMKKILQDLEKIAKSHASIFITG